MLNGNKTKALTAFSIDLGVAEKFGLIDQPQGVVGYVLGPKLQFTLHSVTYDDKKKKKGRSIASIGHVLEWRALCGTQPTDLVREVMDQVFQVKNKRLHLSRMVEWQFKNLSASFEKLVGTSKRTVMVYSDLVESTVVGSGKFPLLRESAVIENR